MKHLIFYMLNNMIMLIMMIICIMISVAFLTLFERKILSYIHYRKGPNKVGFIGLLQPFSDALKLLSKEFFYPYKSMYFLYLLAPMLMFFISLNCWMVYPFMTNLFNWTLNSLFFLCVISSGVYGLMISGWSSNSSFSMIGSIRSISQSISYEVTFSISFILTLTMINSMNIENFIIPQKYLWSFFIFWPISLILFISMIAEINRTPFDLSEGESELVSGFNIEYSNSGFVLIFLSEYSSIMFMMFFFNILYFCFNMFHISLYLMTLLFLFKIIWIRATLPRIRYDYLMNFCWMYMLPLALIIFMLYMFFLKFFVMMIFM